MPRFPRLRAQDNYEKKRIYRARYDDLDTNHHVTNSHYFSWFIDMLDRDFLKNHVVETIDIKFDKEVYYGERVYSVSYTHLNGRRTRKYYCSRICW